jgi:hypothetical protein
MAPFSAYFDESGTHGSPIITVAGYIATVEQWAEFAREWDELLRREGLTAFRMSKFEARRGDFTEESGWNNERRLRVQKRLIGIIKRRVNIGIYCSLHLPAYDDLMTGWRREQYGTSYSFCVKNCLAQVSYWALEFKRREPIAYVIEHGAGYNNEINVAFKAAFADEGKREALRLGSLDFKNKAAAIQLQAADMLAYEIWKESCNRYLTPKEKRRPMRRSLQSLFETTHRGTFYDRGELLNAIKLEINSDRIKFPDGELVKVKDEGHGKTLFLTDTSQLDDALADLERLATLFPDRVKPLIDSTLNLPKLFSVEGNSLSTVGASDVLVAYKPSEFLLDNIAALVTLERQGHVLE